MQAGFRTGKEGAAARARTLHSTACVELRARGQRWKSLRWGGVANSPSVAGTSDPHRGGLGLGCDARRRAHCQQSKGLLRPWLGRESGSMEGGWEAAAFLSAKVSFLAIFAQKSQLRNSQHSCPYPGEGKYRVGCRIQRRAHFPDARNGRGPRGIGMPGLIQTRAPVSQGHAFPSLSLRLPKGDRLKVGLAGLGSVWGAPHWRARPAR